MRPERAAPARPTDVGGSTTAPVCDPGTVSDAADPAPVTEAWVAPTWEQVVRDHSARVYRLAYRLSGNPQDAEDLTQETYVRVFRSLARRPRGAHHRPRVVAERVATPLPAQL